ncbi:MAG: hypothetical protein DMG96_37565 [Acidobacteria bacterium]|nr:MAG: hypothetical protein DMG96_37565 [Acidobacteriota bacterium]
MLQRASRNRRVDVTRTRLHRISLGSKVPENPTVHYDLGLAYEKTEQPALARQHLERVLKINPNYSSAADVKKLLAQLHS